MGTEVKVIRSISDVVKNKNQQQCETEQQQQQQQNKSKEQLQQQQVKQLSGRKTKEERRISNRQKLLSLKRHSGFLKRPEILETVYSVEEDGEGAAQAQQQAAAAAQKDQQLQQQQQQSQESAGEAAAGTSSAAAATASGSSKEGNKSVDTLENQLLQRQFVLTDSPTNSSGSRRGSIGIQLTGFRYRLDSDMTGSDIDYSTDDDSTRIFYSETTTDISTSCSQPCSRRSSYGTGICSLPCSRRSSYGHNTPANSTVASCEQCQCSQCWGSLTGSRRSSYGSHINLSTNATNSDIEAGGGENSELKVQTVYNRVMSNHRTMTKPKDVKFKRINKAKSRSLEELRGKLKWQVAPNSGGRLVVHHPPPARAGGEDSPLSSAPGASSGSSAVRPAVSGVGGPPPPLSGGVAGGSGVMLKGTTMALNRRRGLFKHCASLDQSDA